MSQEKTVSLNVRGVVIPQMRVIKASRKGRCDRTRKWFDPGTTIAFKHKDQLTDEMIRVLFGDGPVFHVTVVYNGGSSPKAVPAKPTPRPVPDEPDEDDIPF